MLKVGIIVGSTRPGRKADTVARWVREIAARRGDVERAHLLWGAVEAEERRGGPLGQWEAERDDYAAKVGIRDGGELDPVRTRGRRLSLAAAIDEALRPAGEGGP